MGIKNFTKLFENSGEFKYKSFNGKNVVIDASVEIYRAALGMKMSEQLTNSFGVPTSHINTILLGVILKLKAAGANQYWIFDHNKKIADGEMFHNPLKQLELKKRKEKRAVAFSKLEQLKNTELFSDESDIEDNLQEIDRQEKIAFYMKQFYIEDTLFLLNSLDVPWMESPAGYESEQIAAMATNISSIFGVKMDYVFSSDSDALIFGARDLIKRDIRKKKLFGYNLATILATYELTQKDLIKIALILGCDFAPKTPRIGVKTVLKKYNDIVLTDEQNEAFHLFDKKMTNDELSSITINNSNVVPFTNEKKYTQLLDWLELVKNYNRERIIKQFNKLSLFSNII